MIDLTSLLPGDPVSALVPTSQHGGNQVADNSHAMTAPGGASGDLGNDLGEAVVVDAPEVEATQWMKGPAGPWHSRPHDDGEPTNGKDWSPPAPSWKNAPAHSN